MFISQRDVFLLCQKPDGKVGMFSQRFAKQIFVIFGITNICSFQKVQELFYFRHFQRKDKLLVFNKPFSNSPWNSFIQEDRYLLLFARSFNEERNLLYGDPRCRQYGDSSAFIITVLHSNFSFLIFLGTQILTDRYYITLNILEQ